MDMCQKQLIRRQHFPFTWLECNTNKRNQRIGSKDNVIDFTQCVTVT